MRNNKRMIFSLLLLITVTFFMMGLAQAEDRRGEQPIKTDMRGPIPTYVTDTIATGTYFG